ncbi:ribonuclease H2, subunit B [Phascolomyces articulosus]|uniref:Ribonuclease H2 subunit B n=1 Tax=Phascolomyces articulosus TaxID=60185 RepID=A0AAD5PJM8_9FUNG|nr:ribonuclease H2, subunit B [Phascolomyces articulosus]
MTNNTKFIALTTANRHDLESLTPIHLPSPQTGQSTLYLHDNDHQHIYEVQRVTGVGRKTSWLIDDILYKDGTMRHITHVDPLFIALPILENARKESDDKFRILDDIFSFNQDENNLAYLLRLKGFQEQLTHLCDTQEVAQDMHVYRLNDQKALTWLQKKVDQLVPKFDTISLLKSSITEDLEKATTEEEKQDVYRQEATYLLSKYLNESWFTALLKHLGLKEIEVDQEMGDITNYFTGSTSTYFKASQTSTSNSTSAETGPPAKKRKPEVPRSLAKVNTRGMKSLTSFFQKKEK